MAIYRYHGSKVYTMDFMFMGQRIRESTHQTSGTMHETALRTSPGWHFNVVLAPAAHE